MQRAARTSVSGQSSAAGAPEPAFVLLFGEIVILALVMEADRNINISKWLRGLGNLAHASFWSDLDCDLKE